MKAERGKLYAPLLANTKANFVLFRRITVDKSAWIEKEPFRHWVRKEKNPKHAYTQHVQLAATTHPTRDPRRGGCSTAL